MSIDVVYGCRACWRSIISVIFVVPAHNTSMDVVYVNGCCVWMSSMLEEYHFSYICSPGTQHNDECRVCQWMSCMDVMYAGGVLFQ